MTDSRPLDPPSPFVAHWVRALSERHTAPERALDIAMGRGRHAGILARAGYRVFGVDNNYEAVRDARRSVAVSGGTLRGWCGDLTMTSLPRGWFDVIVVARYLQRDLFPSIVTALAPGGVVLYETFTEAQRHHGRGPTSPDHLLKPGELPTYFEGLETLAYEEVDEPEAVARLAAKAEARRRS
jgi:SAM-dependent methyltransferase